MSTTIRQLASSLLFAAVAALTAGACAVDEPPSTDRPVVGQLEALELWLDATEYAGPNGPLTRLAVPGDEPITLPGSLCECTTAECRVDWVRENLGCGVCVMVDCGDHRDGACVPCGDAPRGSEPDRAHRPAHAPADDSGATPPPAAVTDGRPVHGAIDLAALGGECGEELTCSADLTCISGGFGPHELSSSCEIACPVGDKQCPSGTECVTIFDGPGRVCRPSS